MPRPEQDYNPLDETDDVDRVDPADPFSPPLEPCECYCLHCGRTFSSEGIWLQRYRQPPRDALKGIWMCPTPNCDGRGFTFDIFPTDPDHPCNAGWSTDEECDEAETQAMEEALLEQGLSVDEDPGDERFLPPWDLAGPDGDYDPAEPQYRALDEELGLSDADGEEWKLGLLPGDYPLDFMSDLRDGVPARRDNPRYDQPDQRPREIDYAEPDYRFNEGDIPF